MTRRLLLLVAVLVAGAVVALPGCKKQENGEEAEVSPAKEEPAAREKPQTKVVLTCGMAGHPQFEPGKEPADGRCPQCEMKLVTKEIPVEKEN